MMTFVPGPLAPVPDGFLAVPMDPTAGLVVLTVALVAGVAAILFATLAARGWPCEKGAHDGDHRIPQAA
ncbi:MAG TPA: hypothetical protein VIS07_12690 [Candidatus Binatia bacterium]